MSVLARVLAGIGAAIAAAGAWGAFTTPSHSFVPYMVFLLSVPFFALAAGLATGGVRHVRSREREVPHPVEASGGWWEVPVFRSWLAMRDASAATWAILAFAGCLAFGHYFVVTVGAGVLSMLVFLAWLWFLARLAWSVLKRTLVARSLDEARLFIRPRHPNSRVPFQVRVEQAAPRAGIRETKVRALEVTLVGERTTYRKTSGGKTRPKKETVFREQQVAARDADAFPGVPLRGETAFQVPAEALEGEGFLAWRAEVRTRLAGPDYRTRFPISTPDEED